MLDTTRACFGEGVHVAMCLVCRRVDTSEAHAERAVLREQLDRAYDILKLKRTEERNMVQDVAQVCAHAA